MKHTARDIGKAIIGFDRGIGDDALGSLLVEHPHCRTADSMRHFLNAECHSSMQEFMRRYASRRHCLQTVEQTFVDPDNVLVYRQICNRVLNQLYKEH